MPEGKSRICTELMKPLNPNSMIQGRYLVVQPIGKGGMGEVYLAVDQRLGSAVALKRTFFSEDSALGAAFEREARILARLRHPVLPKVIDHFSENGDQFLVMEHISGDDVAKRMETANKPFPLSWVMFWSDQMLDALAYLHSHEPPIIHRDIKPQNLKLTDDNHIVLLDFGLSKDFDSNSASGVNSASVAGYSPHFASMEQIRGTGTDARSDLYSLAATLYQMLANVMPPDALTRADSLIGGKGDPIRPLNELNSEVTELISDVILKAVAIRQDERYTTAAEMQKALRRAFNKDKADIEVKPSSEPPVFLTASENPTIHSNPTERNDTPSEVPEMETQIRFDAPAPMDATMQMSPDPAAAPKQSDLKTAVFNVEPAPQDKKIESDPPVEATKASAAAAVAAVPFTAPMPVVNTGSQAVARAPGSPKKSRAGMVIGLLVGLLLLAGVAGAAGWYLLARSNSASTGRPASVPANTATPASTPVLASEADPNSNSSANSQIGAETITNEANTASVSTVPGSTTTKPTTPVAVKTQPKTTQVPADKNKPKPKAKDEGPVIVQ